MSNLIVKLNKLTKLYEVISTYPYLTTISSHASRKEANKAKKHLDNVICLGYCKD